MATEPSLQEDTEGGKPQRGIKALEVVTPLASRKCACPAHVISIS